MPLKSILFAAGFAICTVGGLFVPMLGVMGYMLHYSIGPERQWWAASVNRLGLRYSFTLAAATGIGMFLHWRNLRFGKSFLTRQEKLMLVFLGLVWLSTLMTEETVGRYIITDHPSVKFTKICIFAMMLTHVVTDLRKLDWILWVLVIGALFLGLQAYDTPRRAFMSGRLNSVGGPDFSETNYLAAFLAAMLPIIGVQFLRSRWVGKTVAFLAGGFAANAIVLTRSRGGFLGLACGAVAAACFAPRKHRAKIMAGIILAIAGGFYLADAQFLERMTTITRSAEERDTSAQSRIEFWRLGGRILADHPLGIGAGNWYQNIGKYQEEYAGKDAHNAFVKCAVELGIQGLVVFLLVIGTAIYTLLRIMKEAVGLPSRTYGHFAQLAFGLTVAITVAATCCVTMTLLYIEALWWLLLLPVCLQRALENAKEQAPLGPEVATEAVPAVRIPHRRRRSPAISRR